MTCALTHRRCRGADLVWPGYLALGAWLELRGYRKGCHRTFSRDSKGALVRAFGPRGIWTAFLAGAWFTHHLHRLPDLIEETS